MPPTKKEVIPAIPHAWISAEFLMLKAQENRLDYANAVQPAAASSFANGEYLTPHYEWNPGIRVNAGYQLKKWAVFIEAMMIQNKAKGTLTTPVSSGFYPILSSNPSLTSADSVTSGADDWRLNLGTLAVGGFYPYRPYSNVLLKPHAALKFAVADQRLNAFYGGGFFNQGFDQILMRNRFYGAGPEIGLMPTLYLSNGFSLLADGSFSALAGRFLVSRHETYLTQTRHQSKGLTRLCLALNAKVALNWQKELLYKAFVVSTQLGWEWHQLYNQNHFFVTPQSQPGSKNLNLQGVYFSATLGF